MLRVWNTYIISQLFVYAYLIGLRMVKNHKHGNGGAVLCVEWMNLTTQLTVASMLQYMFLWLEILKYVQHRHVLIRL